MTNSPDTPETSPLVEHLIELRNRLMYCLLATLLVFLALFAFANDIYTFVGVGHASYFVSGVGFFSTGFIR